MLLLILCLPLALRAQQPARQRPDTVIKQAYLYVSPIRSVKVNNSQLIIKPIQPRQLTIAGTYTVAAALITANATPALQNQYVQGESENGVLALLPNDPLSYGPHVHSLQYDGPVYNNSILRRGYKLSHSLYVKAGIQKDISNPLAALALDAGQSTENLILRNNNNTGNHLGVSADRFLGKHLSISGGYNISTGRSTNSNQYGFLNHIYENALLTPINDPYSPPNSPNHGQQIKQQTGFVGIQQRSADLNFSLRSSIDVVDNKINQEVQRNQHETHYNTDGNAIYTIHYPSYRWTSTAKFHLLHNTDDVQISYPIAGPSYHYNRTTDEGGFSFATTYNYDYTTTGFTIGDKSYSSTTSTQHSFLLPELSAFVFRSNILPYQYSSSAKLAATYSAFYSEPALNRFWNPFLLTQLLPQASAGFMPTTEAGNVNGLSPIRHQEFTAKLELTFWYWLTASADLSFRTSKDNPYPVNANGQLELQNLADLRYRGLELSLTQTMYRRRSRQLTISNTLTFWRYTNIVTNIAGGLDSVPIAGFSNVHNTLIKGQPLGVITGNTYLTNANHQMLLGDDGFPLAGNKPTVIGNPTPDLTLKLSQTLAWQRLTLSVDWRYVKGGDIWDGTQSVLDYYGRSAATGSQRNTTNYVFPGVMNNGAHNAVPVSFYDPSLPVTQNRWVRYGYTGVAQAYMQKGDNLRINLLSLAYTIPLKGPRQQIRVLAYAENLLVWSAYKGGDPQQRLFDQPDASGLDFFNLPSPKSFGLNVSIQF